MSSETRIEAPLAIRARGLGKAYHVYDKPQDRLKQLLWPGRRRFYREFAAVHDVDLDVRPGETLGIVGRNGSGKSTLLKMISGTLEPTEGELEVRGRMAPILVLGAGFNPEFTGRENVRMNAALLGFSDAEISERLDAIVHFAGIGPFFEQPVKSYSGGMYARLAFAVAIHTDPDVLVVDEVLAVGDEAFTRKCFARIEDMKRSGTTILFASHAANVVVEICDRAVLLDAGERLLTGDPKTVIGRYQRLLYATEGRAETVREEIRELDRSGVARDAAQRPARNARLASADTPEAGDCGRLDPNLRSESMVEYEPRGAMIHDPHIVARDGSRVNVLRPGQIYTYAYHVTFSDAALGVRFGMMLKLPTGLELGGQASHGAGGGIEYVAPGSVAHVRFRFRAALGAGGYFLNAGVVGFVEDAETHLHRVLDAVLFRIEGESPECVTGRVDLSADSEPELQIEPPAALESAS